jgi:transposase
MSDKEYYTIEEVAKMVGRNRATVYNRMKFLGIKPHKFHMDRKAYVTTQEVERIRTVFEKPWTAGEKTEEQVA